MNTISGIYGKANVFSNDIEDYAKAQLKMICDNPIAQNSSIKVMPDVHPGNVGPIGLTMTINDRIIPNLLGVDIGCGMTCTKIKAKSLELQKLDKVIIENIPSGRNIRKKIHYQANEDLLKKLRCHKHINVNKALYSLGTLGSGNHFIELDKDTNGDLYLVVHTGSRHLGKEVTDYYVSKGATILKENNLDVPYPMTWISNQLMEDYIFDVQIVQEYAQENRNIIINEILKNMKWKEKETFSSIHNYIDILGESKILRKGAISAKLGEKVIIPINMRDGIILGLGKGNNDWNESAPHGAGRVLNRSDVKNHFTVSDFKKEMNGIYCTCINTDTLDEAPFAYRSIDKIKPIIIDTIDITNVLKPIYNFKAGE